MDIVRVKSFIDHNVELNKTLQFDNIGIRLDIEKHYALIILLLGVFISIKKHRVVFNYNVDFDIERLKTMSETFDSYRSLSQSSIYFFGYDHKKAIDILNQHNREVKEIFSDDQHMYSSCEIDYRFEEYWQQLNALSTLRVDIIHISNQSISYFTKGYFQVIARTHHMEYLAFYKLLEIYKDITLEELMFFMLYHQLKAEKNANAITYANTKFIKSLVFDLNNLNVFEANKAFTALFNSPQLQNLIHLSYRTIKFVLGENNV